MANAEFGEYAAFLTPGGIRYQKNKKMVSVKSVPPEVVSFLKKKLGVLEEIKPVPETPRFPRPSEEELAKMRAESQEVAPELARSDAEMAAARPVPIEVTEPTPAEVPLTSEDFEEPSPNATEAPADQIPPEPPEPADFDDDFLEQISIHTASISDIAEALYTRFGIYTAYLGRLPVADEINPLTAEAFTKYHLGIAYQAAIRVQNSGILNRPAEAARIKLEQNRAAAANLPLDNQPETMGEARRQNSFAYRTSVAASQPPAQTEIIHVKQPDGTYVAVTREIPPGEIGKNNGAAQRYDRDEDAPIVEPQMGKKVIRPDW